MKYCCKNNQRIDTCYFEFQKGKYTGECWLDTSICMYDQIFDDLKFYKVFTEVVAEFDYYGITEINKEQWQKIKLISDKIGGDVKDDVAEIDSWAEPNLAINDIITVLEM